MYLSHREANSPLCSSWVFTAEGWISEKIVASPSAYTYLFTNQQCESSHIGICRVFVVSALATSSFIICASSPTLTLNLSCMLRAGDAGPPWWPQCWPAVCCFQRASIVIARRLTAGSVRLWSNTNESGDSRNVQMCCVVVAGPFGKSELWDIVACNAAHTSFGQSHLVMTLCCNLIIQLCVSGCELVKYVAARHNSSTPVLLQPCEGFKPINWFQE
jgi:hypothetical protein